MPEETTPRSCAVCGAANAPDAGACSVCGSALSAVSSRGQSVSSAITGPMAAAQPDSTLTLPLPTDHLLNGRYRLLGRIGQGGMGVVYRAEDTHLGNRIVAIKEMSARGLNQQELAEATQAFQREALLLAQLSHPNLPHIYEQLNEGNRWYLVMDYIEGETLETYLARAPGGRLSVQETLQLGIQLASVLSYLHTRQPPIIFRDLKPSNIMLTLDGRLYLIDFGIARIFKPGQHQDTIPFGSSGYAAPEQYGKAQTTPQADIFSLGATLHQLLSGTDPSQTPFVFAPLHLKGQGAGLEALIRRMVETDKTRRPYSMEEVKQELQRLASPQTAPMQPASAPTFYPSPSSRPSASRLPGSRQPAGASRVSFGPRLRRPTLQGYIVGGVLLIFILMIPISIPLISSAFSGGGKPATVIQPTGTPLPTLTPTPTLSPTATDTPGPSPPPLPFVNGAAEYLIDAGTGSVLYAENVHEHLPIASTTKIMTAILAIENGDLNDIVPITQDELNEVPPDGTTAYLRAGDDNMTLHYLLYGLMLPSGCDAAIVIAHEIAGSTASFVDMMNAKAAALGLADTHYTNPHGATDDPNNYSSVADLVTLANYAMKNATFAEIVGKQHYEVSAQTNRHDYPWDNTNALLSSYSGADGVKTGSLLDWFCIVFSATRNGRRLIGAELGAPTRDLLYKDAARLLDKGFGS